MCFLAQSWSHCQRLVFSNSAGSSFVHCSVQALCSAWKFSAFEPHPDLGVQGSQNGPWAHHNSGEQSTARSPCSIRTQDLTSHTRKHLQNLGWMTYKQFLFIPALAPWWKHWIKSFKLLLNETPLGKNNNAVYSRDFFLCFLMWSYFNCSLVWCRLRCLCFGSVWHWRS